MATYTQTVTLARELFEDAEPTNVKAWKDLTEDERHPYRVQAEHILLERELEEATTEARRVKLSAVDAYRARIAGTIPAHRLDTRQNGFMDGWDAAMAYMQGDGK